MAISIRTLITVGMFIGILLVGFPKLLSPPPEVLLLPVSTIGVVFIISTAILAVCSNRSKRPSTLVRQALYVVFMYMIVRGWLNSSHENFTWYFYARELMFIVACLAGVEIARWASAEQWRQLAIFIVRLATGLLLIHSILLLIMSWGKARILDPALFSYCSAILILLPPLAGVREAPRASPMETILGFGTLVLYAAISGTRSLLLLSFLGAIVVVVITVWTSRKGSLTALKILASVSVVIALLFFFGAFDNVIDRMKDTNISGEARAREIEEVWETRDYWFVWGLGIGVGLDTVVAREAGLGSLVNAPHVGIASWPIKSGLVGWAFVSIVVWTLTGAIGRAIFSRRPELSWTGLGMYVLISCISGGWTPFELFLLGFCIGKLSPVSQVRSVAIRQPFNGFRRTSKGQDGVASILTLEEACPRSQS